jgi:hypothetical protein
VGWVGLLRSGAGRRVIYRAGWWGIGDWRGDFELVLSCEGRRRDVGGRSG